MKNDILERARSQYRETSGIAYPEGLSVSSRWKGGQRKIRGAMDSFKSCEEAVTWCQRNVGFDHRYRYDIETRGDGFTRSKIWEVDRCFPDFFKAAGLEESVYSGNAKKFKEGIYSSAFLDHLYFCLRNIEAVKDLGRVLEIGAGYGNLARSFKSMIPDLSYVIVDLPEALFFSYVYLSLNFPDAKIKCITENSLNGLDGFDFVLVPAQLNSFVEGGKFDLAINLGGFQEMPFKAVEFWIDFIQSVISIRFFYSVNRFLNQGKKAGYKIWFMLDSRWRRRIFEIGPKILAIDQGEIVDNTLELCMERLYNEKK